MALYKKKFAHYCLKPLNFSKGLFTAIDNWNTWYFLNKISVTNGQMLDLEHHESHTEKPQLNCYLQVNTYPINSCYCTIF